jgi:hypothetical protein
MSQKIVQYQAVLQLAQSAPQIYDLPYLHRQMIDTLGVKNASKIIPVEEDQKPSDPISENMAFLVGKPTKAFMYQDHEAHIQVHTSMMQDPKIMQMVGQGPQAQQIMGAIQAHIMQHVAFQYRREIEKQLGAALPPVQEPDGEQVLPPEIEVQLSQLAAAAAARVLQKDQAEVQQQQAAQQAQDPVIQMQQMDLQIKQMEAETKKMKAEMEMQIQQAELQRKQQKDLMDAAANADRLELERTRMEAEQEIEGARLGIDIAKSREAAQNKE